MNILGLWSKNFQKIAKREIGIFGEMEKMVLNLIIGKVYLKDQHGSMMKIQNNIFYIYLVKDNQI